MAKEPTTVLPNLSLHAGLALRFRKVVLEVTSGPNTGLSAALDSRVLTVGSHRSNGLVLTDPAVSRFHFRIVASERGTQLIDDTSTNGTIVNSIALRDGYIGPGATIGVGNTQISVVTGVGEAEVQLSAETHFGDAIGESNAMREAFALARNAAASRATILIQGETGTGKDVLARAIHQSSVRSEHPFIVFDCAAIPANLIESALFGHLRGAFTGADVAHEGVFRAAHGGTLFLDELGELPLELQPKLLRVLESGEVTPVGSTSATVVDVRIVAATHRDLREMVSRDQFRPDLYYRLAVLPIEIPPLRERREDIGPLVSRFLGELLSDEPNAIEPMKQRLASALLAASNYGWPGNVRELRNVVERAVALAEADQELPVEIGPGGSAVGPTLGPDGSALSLRGRLPLGLAREQFDREYLRDLLSSASGDIKRAAEIAEIHPKSFARLLRRYKINR